MFITWDDCGCFYDQVSPPVSPDGTQEGPRVPLIIVSPYAKPGCTDTTATTFAGILAYTEHTYGLTSLGVNDAGAYDFSGAFNYAQAPQNPVSMVNRPLPASAKRIHLTRALPSSPRPTTVTIARPVISALPAAARPGLRLRRRRRRSAGWRDDRQPGRRSAGDQPADRGGVQVGGHQVAHRVQLRLARGGEAGAGRGAEGTARDPPGAVRVAAHRGLRQLASLADQAGVTA